MDQQTETLTQWYAMRVFGNRIFRIKEEVEGLGAQTYLALRTESGPSAAGGRQRVQIVPSLLFVHWDLDRLNAFKQTHFSDVMIYRRADSVEPAPVDEAEMRMFILVTSALDGRDIEFVGEHFDFKNGDRVRVTGGPYAGAEGVIRRIKRDRKLLVAVNGIAVVAISHIPGAFLEKIDIS